MNYLFLPFLTDKNMTTKQHSERDSGNCRRLAFVSGLLYFLCASQGWASGDSPPDSSTPGGAYAQSCASCHGPEMRGSEAAPSLRGPQFFFTWNGKSIAMLLDYVKTMMPPGQVGDLSDTDYRQVIAAILTANHLLGSETQMPATSSALAAFIIKNPH